MRTYYDPEDNSFCDKTDRYEPLIDRADYLRTERKDREMAEAQEEEPTEPFPGVE